MVFGLNRTFSYHTSLCLSSVGFWLTTENLGMNCVGSLDLILGKWSSTIGVGLLGAGEA